MAALQIAQDVDVVNFPDYIVTITPCPACKGERLAALAGLEAWKDKPARTLWWRWCPVCVDLDATQPGSPGEPRWLIWWTVAMDQAGEVRWWMRRGASMSAAESHRVLMEASCFDRLLPLRRAREASGKGKWKLELREDGRVWIPYDRASEYRSGTPMPLREGTIRKPRKCYACRGPVLSGSVWKPDVGPRGTVGWSRDLLDLVVCLRCHHAAARAELVEAGGRPRRGLVVFDGADEGVDVAVRAALEVVRG